MSRAVCRGLLIAAFSGLSVSPLSALGAGFPVVDVPNLGQSIMRVMNSFKQISNQVLQIQKLVEQIQNQARALKTLDASLFFSLTDQFTQQYQDLNRLLGQLTVVKYRSASIKNEFTQLFPKGADWKKKPLSAYGDYYARWHGELLGAAMTAMDAQSTLSQLGKRNSQIKALLSQAASADGTVRQLQIVNEMLAVGAGHLTDLSTALITTSRMTATATAAQASAERAGWEAAIRARKNYTFRGKPVPVLKELPKISQP